MPGAEFTLVIPSSASSDPLKASTAGRKISNGFKGIIVAAITVGHLDADQKIEYLDWEFGKRTVS